MLRAKVLFLVVMMAGCGGGGGVSGDEGDQPTPSGGTSATRGVIPTPDNKASSVGPKSGGGVVPDGTTGTGGTGGVATIQQCETVSTCQAGPAGPVGVSGIAGPVGPSGPQGLVGPQGPMGVSVVGPQGIQGIAGPAGPSGSGGSGSVGPAGPAGSIGLTGADGQAGPQGQAGPIGLTGPKGDVGPGSDPNTSGTRVKARYSNSLDGARVFTGWHDTGFDIPCSWLKFGSTTMYCVPETAWRIGMWYEDAACVQPVAVASVYIASEYTSRVSMSNNAIEDQTENWAVGGSPASFQIRKTLGVVPSKLYVKSNGTCLDQTSAGLSATNWKFVRVENVTTSITMFPQRPLGN